MTWLRQPGGRGLDWDGVTAMFPRAADSVTRLHRVIWERGDPALLELCRLRIAALLEFEAGLRIRSEKARAAGLTQDKIESLNLWPTSPLFSERERACLALAEQLLMDASGMTDEIVDDVLEHLPPSECYALVQAVSAMETLHCTRPSTITRRAISATARRRRCGWPTPASCGPRAPRTRSGPAP
jgi:alkylhydroperoxidase family enzyme